MTLQERLLTDIGGARDDVANLVDGLFVSGDGTRADRLVLTVDGPPRRDLGGWCKGAIVDRICEWLAEHVEAGK